MEKTAKRASFAFLLAVLMLLLAPSLSFSGGHPLQFQTSAQSSFNTLQILQHMQPGRAIISGTWNSPYSSEFTVKLYSGSSTSCQSDTTLVQTTTSRAPPLPPLPGGMVLRDMNTTAYVNFLFYPSNNPNTSSNTSYFCFYVNDSTGVTKNSTTIMLNFSQIPPAATTSISSVSISTTTYTTSATTSVWISYVPHNSTVTFLTTIPQTSVTSVRTTVPTTNRNATTGNQVSCGCVCSGTCVRTTNVTPRHTVTATSSVSTSTTSLSTTTVIESQAQSLINRLTNAANSPYQPTLGGSITSMANILRWLFSFR
jgi:hypothetical protein